MVIFFFFFLQAFLFENLGGPWKFLCSSVWGFAYTEPGNIRIWIKSPLCALESSAVARAGKVREGPGADEAGPARERTS